MIYDDQFADNQNSNQSSSGDYGQLGDDSRPVTPIQMGQTQGDQGQVKDDTKHPIIMILPEQYGVKEMGGTMRLGSQPILIKEGTLAHKLYRKREIYERHRHRYEVNPDYIDALEKNGLVFSGIAEDKIRMEILELPDHPYFIASQFHPEFKSRPLKPAPLFYGFIDSAVGNKKG